ncbi:MAG: DUF5993 family protein [Candidatus Dasytiphilus stammeri]
MYLTFLIALIIIISFLLAKKKIGYLLWALLLIVTLTLFKNHITQPLNLSF